MVAEGGGVPLSECRSPVLCIPAERTGRDGSQISPGPKDLKHKVKKGRKVAPCAFSTVSSVCLRC